VDSKIWYIPVKNDRLEKKVGIYCRVSTNEREQLYSLAAQISALTRAVANVVSGDWQMFLSISLQRREKYLVGNLNDCFENVKLTISPLSSQKASADLAEIRLKPYQQSIG